jgi:hypothetical protein
MYKSIPSFGSKISFSSHYLLVFGMNTFSEGGGGGNGEGGVGGRAFFIGGGSG